MATVAEDSEGIAAFRDDASMSILVLRTGESHAGWTLSTVKPREVTMLRDHDTGTPISQARSQLGCGRIVKTPDRISERLLRGGLSVCTDHASEPVMGR